MTFGREQFRVIAYKGRSNTPIVIDDFVEGLNWSEVWEGLDTPYITLSGTLQMRYPTGSKLPSQLTGARQVALQVARAPGGGFRQVWLMRIVEPERNLADGLGSYTLASDLARLRQNEDDWRFAKSRRRPNGVLGHEIIRQVCARLSVRLGRMPRMRHRIKKLVKLETSPLDVIVNVLRKEQVATGRRLALDYRQGRLDIVPLRHSSLLYVLGPMLIEATMRASLREDFATALTVRGQGWTDQAPDSQGHKVRRQKKVAVKVSSPASTRKFGYVHRIVYLTDRKTRSEARTIGRRQLARLAKPRQEFTLRHPGLPDLHPLQAVKVHLADLNYRRTIYVKQVDHELAAGRYDMQVTLAVDDPLVDVREERVTETRDEAAERRRRPKPKAKVKKKKKKPKRAADREEKQTDRSIWYPVGP